MKRPIVKRTLETSTTPPPCYYPESKERTELRDGFVRAIITGQVAMMDEPIAIKDVARFAYNLADALMEERDERFAKSVDCYVRATTRKE